MPDSPLNPGESPRTTAARVLSDLVGMAPAKESPPSQGPGPFRRRKGASMSTNSVPAPTKQSSHPYPDQVRAIGFSESLSRQFPDRPRPRAPQVPAATQPRGRGRGQAKTAAVMTAPWAGTVPAPPQPEPRHLPPPAMQQQYYTGAAGAVGPSCMGLAAAPAMAAAMGLPPHPSHMTAAFEAPRFLPAAAPPLLQQQRHPLVPQMHSDQGYTGLPPMSARGAVPMAPMAPMAPMIPQVPAPLAAAPFAAAPFAAPPAEAPPAAPPVAKKMSKTFLPMAQFGDLEGKIRCSF
eukprot:Transcript_28056.p1 GENE.Transcript_28056~~Transcript_28056.p1  ORF type:complete len:291 (-),score=28.02 Transcript_28056:230-1102(-)